MRIRTAFVIALVFSFTLALGTAFAAKPVIGVAEFKNESGAGWWRGGMGRELAGALSNELASGEKFTINPNGTCI